MYLCGGVHKYPPLAYVPFFPLIYRPLANILTNPKTTMAANTIGPVLTIFVPEYVLVVTFAMACVAAVVLAMPELAASNKPNVITPTITMMANMTNPLTWSAICPFVLSVLIFSPHKKLMYGVYTPPYTLSL